MGACCWRLTIIRILFTATAMAIITQSQSSPFDIGRASGELRMVETMRPSARREHGQLYNGRYAASKKSTPRDWMRNAQENRESLSPYVSHSLLALQYSRRLKSMPGEQEAMSTANLRTEVEALIAFRKGVTLDPLGALSSWNLSDDSACHWRGVICAPPSESIVSLELGNLELVGSINPLLGSLENLQNLNLSNNLFSGGIPSSLANCSKISNLALGGNNFTGEIPFELGDLLQLQSLDLSNNAFLGGTFPSSLGNCSLLRLLLLNSTNLDGEIPSSVGQLVHLEIMDLSLTALSGPIPKSLGNCSSLTQLYMGNYNDVDKAYLQGELPQELGHLVQLRRLGIDGSSIVGKIPGWIANLTRLNYISLSYNSLTGEIPDFLGQLPLTGMDFGENNLTGAVPVSITNCSKLTYLVLEVNSLSGFMPPELGLLTELGILSLTSNEFSGTIPFSIANCSALTALLLAENPFMNAPKFPPWIVSMVNLSICYLADMNLQGVIPADIGKLSQLQDLMVSVNNLTGQIPATIGNATTLVMIELYENQLSGEIPSGMWTLSQLQSLVFSENLLTGPLPASIGNMSQMVTMAFDFNSFSGVIPQDVGSLQNLQRFVLSENNFDGYIPTFLGNSSALQMLWLNANRLIGTIPPSLGNLTGLQSLFLDSNVLEGSIPAELASCLELSDFYLYQNFLHGSIPEVIGRLPSLQYVYLNNNNLSGIIPESFSTCGSCLYVDLSYNAFSGALPAGLFSNLSTGLISWNVSHNLLSGALPGSLESLLVINYLDFSANNFSGSIPSGLVRCKSLISLDLSVNSLSGSIPATLGQLPYLTFLNVSGNVLEGPIPGGGIFATGNVTATSFSGNAGLCGSLLGRPCPNLAPTPSEAPPSISCRGFQCNSIRISVACGAAAFSLLLLGLLVLPCRSRLYNGRSDTLLVTFQKGLKLSMDDVVAIMEGPENKIGAGANSTVYKGMLRGGKAVAIKALTIRVGDTDHDDKQAKADLLREAQTLSQLRHRNILKVLGFYRAGEVVALITELMPEGSVNDYLYPSRDDGAKKCELKWDTTLNIALGVAHGLAYLHSQVHEPVIHRDLKPSNVFLDADLEPKLGDFGISRCANPGRDGEKTVSTFCGTLGYIPPEYGATMRVSTKGDVYSYGVTLLELLTRKQPILTEESANEECRMLVDWVLESLEENPRGNLDTRLITESINNENQREQMKLLMHVGVLCTQRDPQNRPHMTDVLAMVNQIKDRGCDRVQDHPSLEELAHKITISDTSSSSEDESSESSTPLSCTVVSDDCHVFK